MSVERPTFHESWYRVRELKPRLRASVQSYRQHYRGRIWHVIHDPASTQFFRLDDASYHFAGLLDGQRTVAQVWEICGARLGDRGPTQGEAIRLLGQLHTASLLHADLPPDAAEMFERYRKRRVREVGGYFINILFPRFPLWNPDRFLTVWAPAAGWVFSWFGVALWAALLALGVSRLAGRWDQLWTEGSQVLDPSLERMLLLYLAFAGIKAIHEMGHGLACKKFGLANGSGGAVPTIGIMLLVFMPMPYVDASSSWTFRGKWQRVVVAAAGMYVELAVAAVAAMVWAATAEQSLLHNLSYNLMFVASVSTLLFNANPLLRFDGYYILSDLTETPNLAQRGKEFVYYLARRFVFGVRHVLSPANTPGERPWLLVYAVASSIYRVFISVGIILFVHDKLFFVGAAMALAALVGWLVVPLVKFGQYLLTNPELGRTRGRAALATLVVAAGLVGLLGFLPLPDRGRAEGVVEPVDVAVIYQPADGFVLAVLPSGQAVEASGWGAGTTPLLVARNIELERELRQLSAERDRQVIARNQALTEQAAVDQVLERRLEALERQISHLEAQLHDLRVRSGIAGVWVAPNIERTIGTYLRQGDKLGLVADTARLRVRVVADQSLGPRIAPELGEGGRVELRVRGRPELSFTGVVERVIPAGQEKLPSAALGYLAGGAIAVTGQDQQGTEAAERFFEVLIRPDVSVVHGEPLMSGQRVVARFSLGKAPLAAQAWRALRQLLQKRG